MRSEEQRAWLLFRVYDRDGDDLVGWEDLLTIVRAMLGEGGDQAQVHDVGRTLLGEAETHACTRNHTRAFGSPTPAPSRAEEFDLDRDHALNFAEFSAMLGKCHALHVAGVPVSAGSSPQRATPTPPSPQRPASRPAPSASESIRSARPQAPAQPPPAQPGQPQHRPAAPRDAVASTRTPGGARPDGSGAGAERGRTRAEGARARPDGSVAKADGAPLPGDGARPRGDGPGAGPDGARARADRAGVRAEESRSQPRSQPSAAPASQPSRDAATAAVPAPARAPSAADGTVDPIPSDERPRGRGGSGAVAKADAEAGRRKPRADGASQSNVDGGFQSRADGGSSQSRADGAPRRGQPMAGEEAQRSATASAQAGVDGVGPSSRDPVRHQAPAETRDAGHGGSRAKRGGEGVAGDTRGHVVDGAGVGPEAGTAGKGERARWPAQDEGGDGVPGTRARGDGQAPPGTLGAPREGSVAVYESQPHAEPGPATQGEGRAQADALAAAGAASDGPPLGSSDGRAGQEHVVAVERGPSGSAEAGAGGGTGSEGRLEHDGAVAAAGDSAAVPAAASVANGVSRGGSLGSSKGMGEASGREDEDGDPQRGGRLRVSGGEHAAGVDGAARGRPATAEAERSPGLATGAGPKASGGVRTGKASPGLAKASTPVKGEGTARRAPGTAGSGGVEAKARPAQEGTRLARTPSAGTDRRGTALDEGRKGAGKETPQVAKSASKGSGSQGSSSLEKSAAQRRSGVTARGMGKDVPAPPETPGTPGRTSVFKAPRTASGREVAGPSPIGAGPSPAAAGPSSVVPGQGDRARLTGQGSRAAHVPNGLGESARLEVGASTARSVSGALEALAMSGPELWGESPPKTTASSSLGASDLADGVGRGDAAADVGRASLPATLVTGAAGSSAAPAAADESNLSKGGPHADPVPVPGSPSPSSGRGSSDIMLPASDDEDDGAGSAWAPGAQLGGGGTGALPAAEASLASLRVQSRREGR